MNSPPAPRSELGTKRTDPETGRKFYDLGKDPVVSPYIGTSYPLSFFEAPAQVSRRPTVERPMHREAVLDEEDAEAQEEGDTVSLSDVEEDAATSEKSDANVDVDDDEDPDKGDENDAFLVLDDEGEDVEDIVAARDGDDD